MASSSISVHCFQLFIIAAEARKRAQVAMTTGPMALAPDALTSIVFAAFATEAFINELGAILEREAISGFQPIPKEYGAAARAIADAEGRKATTIDKVVAAHAALTGKAVDKGREPFQSFHRLMTLRDWIGHSKPQRNATGRAMPPPLKPLAMAGLTISWPDGVAASWLDTVLSDRVADWACRSSLTIIRSTLDLVPKSRGRDFVDHLRDDFALPADSLLSH